MNHPQSDQAEANAQRAAWMRVLALAESSELDGAFGALGNLPAHHMLRPAQSGMAMVRARSGGTGTRFNLGEMTLTRCAVSLENGVVGIAYVQGRSLRHAEQAAVADALLQLPEWHEAVQRQLIAPLAQPRGTRGAAGAGGGAHAGGVLHHGARGRSPKRLRRPRGAGCGPAEPDPRAWDGRRCNVGCRAVWRRLWGWFGFARLRCGAGGWNRVWNWKWTCMHTLSPALAGRRRRRVRGSGGRGAGGVPGGAGGAGASGRVLEIEADCGVPAGMSPAMVALLLTLVDVDTPLWLPAGVDDEVRAFLRFHCGCSMVDQPGEARFAALPRGHQAPALSLFNPGILRIRISRPRC